MGASDFSKLPHIGESLRRKEDYRFLTGAGQYTDDVQMANMTHAYFVRSPHAHAHIKSIDKKLLWQPLASSVFLMAKTSQATASMACLAAG